MHPTGMHSCYDIISGRYDKSAGTHPKFPSDWGEGGRDVVLGATGL